MGYTTTFNGSFALSKPLTPEQAAYLSKFSATRRTARVVEVCENEPDPERLAVGLPLGYDGAYYVGSTADFGMDYGPNVVKPERPPEGQPGWWCAWTPSSDRSGIEWDGSEKFDRYVEWANYLHYHFLSLWGITYAASSVEYQGEREDEHGFLAIENGRVVKKPGEAAPPKPLPWVLGLPPNDGQNYNVTWGIGNDLRVGVAAWRSVVCEGSSRNDVGDYIDDSGTAYDSDIILAHLPTPIVPYAPPAEPG